MANRSICDICERTDKAVHFKMRRKFDIWKWLRFRNTVGGTWNDLDVCDDCLEGIYEYVKGRNSARGIKS